MKENETKTVMLDLTSLSVEMNIDQFETVDVHKEFANFIYRRCEDIATEEKARALYHDGKVELTVEEAEAFRQMTPQFPYIRPLRTAIEKMLTPTV